MSPKPRVRAAVDRMAGYTPGEQPKAGERIIKLNTNENPFPPSPKVMEAIRAVPAEWLRRYPPPLADGFRAVAARLHGVTPDMVLAGNGSDEILAMVCRTFLDVGDVLAYPDPTYSLYPVLAEIGQVTVATVPWEPGWELPIEALLATRARAIFFANPNAPSGTVVRPARIRARAERTDARVLVDEAYVDFAEGDCVGLLADCENVVVSRTLSKAYSLAGLRFGYALAAPALVAQMTKVKDSYNCDALSIVAATAALEDQAYARGTWEFVKGERARVTRALEARGWQVIPSQANFLLATCPAGLDAGAIYQGLKARGILIRWFDKPGLSDKLRLSIGTREENDAVLGALPA